MAPRREPPVGKGRISIPQAEPVHHGGHAPIGSRLPVLIAVAVMLAVGVGAWTGWEAGNDNEEAKAELASAAVKVPPIKARPAVTAAPAEPALGVTEAQSSRPTKMPAARAARPRLPLQIDLAEDQQAEASPADQAPDSVAISQAWAETPAVEPTSAKMPLSNAIIARTIGQIGYPCGRVASTTALETPGVFSITCTSGHTYRAAPVRGRYHFRKY
jgi:hypothetical protein